MKLWRNLAVLMIGTMAWVEPGQAMVSDNASSPEVQTTLKAKADEGSAAPLLAKKSRRADNKKRGGKNVKSGGREKILSTVGRSKKGNRTKIDFDEASIEGNRRTPAGIAITKNRPDQAYDLINLRLRWHPEMVQSTTNLETGRGR